MGFRWQRSPSQAWNMQLYRSAIFARVLAVMASYQGRIEGDTKQNAPWMDRTGNARQTLFARVLVVDRSILLVAAQSVTYGVYLELKNGGRYAVILPTLQNYYQPVWDDVKAVI